jgi:pSer/pThr/pTyr-binding forkhead associated (FHA) protein
MSISKEHAAIQIDKEYNYTLNDLNSVNGSFVNNIKVKTKILKN